MTTTKRHNARNSQLLAEIKKTMNGKIYAQCLKLANENGLFHALSHLSNFYNQDAWESVRWKFHRLHANDFSLKNRGAAQ